MNPFQEAPNAKKMISLFGLYIALLASIMVSTTNSTLLPAAGADIGGLEIYPLAVSVSGFLSICAMPIYAYFGAKNPAIKRPLVTVTLLISAAVLLAQGIAPNMFVIIVAAVFWIPSAGIFVLGFTMIRDMFDQSKSGVYLGFIGTIMSAASLAGPLVGGVLIDQVGWRAFRFVLFALMALGAIMVFMGVKATKEQVKDMAVESDKLDYAGAVAVMALLIGIIIPLSMVSYIPMGSLGSNALFALAVVGLVALILIIRKKKDAAIIPSSVITDRNTIAFALCNFFANFSAMGIMFFIPGYVMRVLFADPLVVSIGPALAAGVTTMLIAALGLVLGPVFGKMIARAGDAKPVIIIGVIARVVVMVAFLFLLNPETPVWIIYIIMFVAGVYNSQNTIAFSAGPQIQLDPSKRVLSNGVIQMGQNIGSGVAMAIFTFLLVAGPVAAMTPMLIISLVMTGFLLVSALLLKKRTPEQSES